jgi:hypothetical protein
MRTLFALLIVLSSTSCVAQKEKEVHSTYSMELPRNVTMEQLEHRCIEQARLKAVGDAFGTILSETTVGNTQEGKSGLNNSFAVLTKTNVKGEWLRDKSEPQLIWEPANKTLKLTANVHGVIREFPKTGKAKIEISLSNDSRMINNITQFKDGQDLFASFQTSSKGNLSVFYVDHSSGEVYRLIPSSSNNDLNAVEVQSDIVYQLFQTISPFIENKSIPSLSLSLPDGKDIQMDELVFVFSPKEIRKPSLSLNANAKMYYMGQSEFEQWKITSVQTIPETVIKNIAISIVKK